MTKKKPCCKSKVLVKSGNYLSSRQLTASTFGVKELNFCVRYGNRWILFAIITAMVIYSALWLYIYVFCAFPISLGFPRASSFKKIYNYTAKRTT